MTNLTILIADDEPPARKKVRSFLQNTAGVGNILEATNGPEAVKCIREEKPDLVLLDIQMPGMTGFEVIESIGVQEMPAVVFVTAYDQYAIAAFEVQAVDYLLKPFDEERFRKSFERARERIGFRTERKLLFENLLAELKHEQAYLERLIVSLGGRFFFVKTDDIVFLNTEEKYVMVHTSKSSHLVRDTLTRLEQRLNPQKFVRIHRSTIVNLEWIKEVQPWAHGDCIVILKDGRRLKLSRRYRKGFFAE